jgi:hypothetical protein
LPATWWMPKLSAKISWPVVFEIQTSSAVSQMVKQWLERINFLDVFYLFWCWRSSWMFIVLNLCGDASFGTSTLQHLGQLVSSHAH